MRIELDLGPTPGFIWGGGARGGDIPALSPELSSPARRAFGPALTPCKRGPRLKANSPYRALTSLVRAILAFRPRAIRGGGEYRPHAAKIGGCHG